MNNRAFYLFIAAFLLAWFSWLGYDAWVSAKETPALTGVRGDLLGKADGHAAQVRYLYHFADPVYSHELDTGHIEALRPSEGHSEDARVRGLTIADYGMESLYEFRTSKRWFKGGYLSWLEDLKVDFRYKDLKVYVASEYPEGSCEYNETKWHEDQHVRIHREVYEKYQALLEKAVTSSQDIPLRSAPVTTTTREEGKRIIGERISAILDPIFQEFDRELREEQGKIDSSSSYDELRGHCSAW